MKRAWIIGISTSAFFILIVIWQISFLNNLKNERQSIQELTSQKLLDEAMPTLRIGTTIGKNLFELKEPNKNWDTETKQFTKTLDSLFAESGIRFDWALWRKDRDTVLLSTNEDILLQDWQDASLQKCFSCFLIVTFPDAIDREGMLMSHSVSEMTALGWEQQDLTYISIFPVENQTKLNLSDVTVFIVILLLGVTLGIVLYINARQKQLIHQKQEFINHLSHQFKTPLASIKLGIKMMLSEPNVNHSKLIQLINIESNRLEKHVQTVLQWLKSDAKNFEVEPKDLNISQLVTSVIEQLNPLLSENSAICNFNTQNNTVFISADEYHLSLLLFNLIENAVSHNEKGITIDINISVDQKVKLKISDKGKGFDVKEALSSSRSLGLAYAKKVMESHDGELILESIVGQGTSISLVFEAKENE
ncbi:MAG: HAMP domain-containing histidine kinase [bacterium]|nr:HAMP domain-containing histidine kinase [bacterium]